MKILIILGTGVLLTFPENKKVVSDCFEQGHSIMQNISTYRESGPTQGWYLNDSNVLVAGFYCE